MNWSRTPPRPPAVRETVSWLSSTSIWMKWHPIACCLLFLQMPGLSIIFKFALWVLVSVLQMQRRAELPSVCVAGGSHWVAHWLKRLGFGSILLLSHLVEVYLEPWPAIVECRGRWSWNEVGSPEGYIVSYKSKWNEWQPTCTVNSSLIRRCIAALHITAGDSNSPEICSKSVRYCLFVCRDISWWLTVDIFLLIDIKRILFDGKDLWWWLSQDISRTIPESHAKHQVLMYG